MKTFDIYSWTPPGWKDAHPVVIISPQHRIDHKAEVNVLACSSQRAGRPGHVHEVILDQSDGLDWATLCRCDIVCYALKGDLKQFRGSVTPGRRRRIIQTMVRVNQWI